MVTHYFIIEIRNIASLRLKLLTPCNCDRVTLSHAVNKLHPTDISQIQGGEAKIIRQ
jgi:hypothetical protein